MGAEIESMYRVRDREGTTGQYIRQEYLGLRNDHRQWGKEKLGKLVEFVNHLGEHPFLRKSVIYLTFIQHCLPLHLCTLYLIPREPKSLPADPRILRSQLLEKTLIQLR